MTEDALEGGLPSEPEVLASAQTEFTELRGDDLAAEVVANATGATPGAGGQATARKAVALLLDKHGFIEPTATQRTNVAMAFAGARKVVYGQAFDVLRVTSDAHDLDDLSWVRDNLSAITLYEVKSSNRNLATGFGGYFFSLSTAELLVAQSLGEQFKFAFVAVNSGEVLIQSLKEIYGRMRAIYPSWSIRF